MSGQNILEVLCSYLSELPIWDWLRYLYFPVLATTNQIFWSTTGMHLWAFGSSYGGEITSLCLLWSYDWCGGGEFMNSGLLSYCCGLLFFMSVSWYVQFWCGCCDGCFWWVDIFSLLWYCGVLVVLVMVSWCLQFCCSTVVWLWSCWVDVFSSAGLCFAGDGNISAGHTGC